MTTHKNSFLITAVAMMALGVVFGYLQTTYTTKVIGAEFCHTIVASDTSLPKGYGSPFNFFGKSEQLTMQVLCSPSSDAKSDGAATLVLGTGSANEYIYKYAFERVDGSWKKILLEGNDAVGPWFRGQAGATLEKSNAELSEKSRIIAYTCNKVGSGWRCGCADNMCAKPHWQMQEYQLSNDQPAPELTAPEGSDEPYVEAVSSYTGYHGDNLMIKGNGFSAENDIYFEDERVAKDVPSLDGTTLFFTVPDDVEQGMTRVYVDAGDGERIVGSRFWVTPPGAEAPKVFSVSPDNGGYGTEVTLTGENFTDENVVFMGIDELAGVASEDGTTLTFKIEPNKDEIGDKVMKAQLEDDGASLPLYLMVSTDAGFSPDPVIFNLTF